MAIYREDFIDVELESGSIFRSFLNHSIGEGDKLANRFGVRVLKHGEPVQMTSVTCTGYFIRADGQTVVVSGVAAGNRAYVELPEACYAVEGQFALAIKLSGGNAVGTMRIVDGVVANTTTGAIVDPGTLVPSIEDLIDAIEAAVASIPQDYSALNNEVDTIESILLYETVKTATSYEASRITNDYTISPEDGHGYVTYNGRAATNVLNNVAYPMDAVYIDSDSYCIRMFGYSESSASTESFVDCTDYIPGGKNNVIYRPDDWPYCRLVIARNPTTQSTAFTEEEIAEIADKLKILKLSDVQGDLAYTRKAVSSNAMYMFENKTSYDSTRITNNMTISPEDGHSYAATNGRAVTRALNGAAYPMDAVYINSGDYCIRLFGYSSSSTSMASYIGCTAYLPGGKEGVLYRPEDWPYCRLVISRNPPTRSDEFTEAEIADIASKLVIMGKNADYTPLGLHEIPKNNGILNIIKRARQLTDIKWTSEINIPRVSMVDGDYYSGTPYYVDDVFLANTEYTGIPYSQRNFVGDAVGIDTFATAMYNSQFTKIKDSERVDRNTAPMYGSVCVTLVSYALNLPIVSSGYYHLIPDLSLIGTVPDTVNDIELGDVLVVTSHVAIITDIIRSGNIVKYVEVSESTKHGLQSMAKQGQQWGGICRRKMWTVEEYARWFVDFNVYRYQKPELVSYSENRFTPVEGGTVLPANPFMPCMPYNGDRSWYPSTTEDVRIIILDHHYTKLVVELNGTEIETYDITAETEYVDVPNSGGGYYRAKLMDASDHVTIVCRWFINTQSTVSFSVHDGIATFTQSRAIDNPPVAIRFGAANDSPYVHAAENIEKTFSNGMYTYTFTVPYDSGHSTFCVYNDAGNYGLLSISRPISS